jgi:hypothetical protein
LRELLPGYANYLLTNGSNSLIARVYGLFTYQIKGQPLIFLMLMPNAVGKKQDTAEILMKFDLKGSMINRQVLPKVLKKGEIKSYYSSLVLKDQDYRFITKFYRPNLVNISFQDKHNILNLVRRDVEFLSSQNIMDYSLFFVIEDTKEVNVEEF